MKPYDPIIDPTVGIEIEFQGVGAGSVADIIQDMGFRVHDDGSTRETVFSTRDTGLPVVLERRGDKPIVCSGLQETNRIGLELVSPAFMLEDKREDLRKFQNFVQYVPTTPRTSVHIHADVGNVPWVYVQNVVRWCYYLEAILYRISCGGETHRGERIYGDRPVDYRYCRPLSNPIGYGMRRSQISPLIDMPSLLGAKTSSQFIAAWGRADVYFSGEASATHYIAHRLHMINIMSLLRYGTLEWRLFDALYDKVELFIDLVRSIHRKAYTMMPPPVMSPMILGSTPNITADQASEIVGVDVSSVWGSRWPSAPPTTHILPHYDGGMVNVDTDMIRTIRHDTGKDTDPLLTR